ncbi:toxin ParE1/3/4 [Bradyrhizobium sp. LB1.3]
MKLVWSRFALSDRDGIFSYIEAENPRAAVHVDEQIADAARRLLDFPDSGRPGRVAGTRELVIRRTPYVAVYLVDGESGALHDPSKPLAGIVCRVAIQSHHSSE